MTCPIQMDNQNGAKAAHVLVVDDDVDILQMVSLCFKQSGYLITTVTSPEEAHRLIDGDSFDAIITDVMMPGEDGITFLGKVHQKLPDVPVIIMTGYAQLQTAVNAIKNGAFDFIHKPFDFSYLRKVVDKAVTYSNLLRMEKNYLAELERTVARRTAELKNAMIRLDENNQALMKAANEKNEFMATISHEMRTPMNGVIGGLELLADAGLHGVQTEYLLLARQAADNMMELVDHMLSFGAASTTGSTHCTERVDIPVAIEAVTLDYRKRFIAKGLSFDIQIAPDVPRFIRSDGEQLAHLLEALLSNALKFTDNGGARLEIALERMEGKRAVIRTTVSDSGVGIPSDMLERIFDPFIQVDGSSTRRFNGAGLGLSIARQTSQLLGGTLYVESSPGEGSSFNFIMQVDVV